MIDIPVETITHKIINIPFETITHTNKMIKIQVDHTHSQPIFFEIFK